MLNSVNLVGRLVHDPEIKTTPSGVSVVTIAIAVERNIADKDGNRATDYIDVVAWRYTAEFIGKWFRKGSWIAVTGCIQTRSYETKDGSKRKSVEVIASEVSFCGGKTETVEKTPAQKLDDLESRVVGFTPDYDDDSDFPF